MIPKCKSSSRRWASRPGSAGVSPAVLGKIVLDGGRDARAPRLHRGELLARWRRLQRVHALDVAHRGHGLEAGELPDIADDLAAMLARESDDRIRRRFRFDRMKRNGRGGARHGM